MNVFFKSFMSFQPITNFNKCRAFGHELLLNPQDKQGPVANLGWMEDHLRKRSRPSTPSKRGNMVPLSSGLCWSQRGLTIPPSTPMPYPWETPRLPQKPKSWLRCLYMWGFPNRSCTDQGTNFTGQVFKQFWQIVGVCPLLTSVYHSALMGLWSEWSGNSLTRTYANWHQWISFLLFAVS